MSAGFLGLARFYRRSIKDFSLNARPMTDLTKEGMPWKWDEEEENSFCELKRSLVVALVLKMPDFHRLFVVTTDASVCWCNTRTRFWPRPSTGGL